MDEVRISRAYGFGAYSIIVSEIPAKRDNVTGSLYVSAWIAKRVQDKVAEISAAVDGLPPSVRGILPAVHPEFSVDATEFLPDAA
jgi:hypothetical protein